MKKSKTNAFDIRKTHLKEGVTIQQDVITDNLIAIVNDLFNRIYLGVVAYDARNNVLSPLNKDAANVALAFCAYPAFIYFDIEKCCFTDKETEVTLLMFLDARAQYNFVKANDVEHFGDYCKISSQLETSFERYDIFQLIVETDADYEIYKSSLK